MNGSIGRKQMRQSSQFIWRVVITVKTYLHLRRENIDDDDDDHNNKDNASLLLPCALALKFPSVYLLS